MASSNAVHDPIELYMLRLNAALIEVPAAQRREYLKEIRAHIFDRLGDGAGVQAALDALGDPESLAEAFRAETALVRTARSWSPWVLLRGILRWALYGLQGYLVFVVAVLGYLFGFAFLLTGLLKPIFPENIGLFVSRHGVTVANWPAPAGHDVLGPEYTPVALVLGGFLCVATTIGLRALMRKFAAARQRVSRIGE